MSVVLPCRNTLLRSRTTQRESRRTLVTDFLEPTVEREMATLFTMEIDFLLKLEQLKRDMYGLPHFSHKKCFRAIDEHSNGFIDQTALRRFLIKVGH